MSVFKSRPINSKNYHNQKIDLLNIGDREKRLYKKAGLYNIWQLCLIEKVPGLSKEFHRRVLNEVDAVRYFYRSTSHQYEDEVTAKTLAEFDAQVKEQYRYDDRKII